MLYLGPVGKQVHKYTSFILNDNTQFTDSECASVFVCGHY